MNLRFSRSSLNLIIFTCIILIGWASINENRKIDEIISGSDASIDSQPYPNIELASLDALNQQTWISQEGIHVIWQSRLDTDFLVRVRGSRTETNSAIDNPHISWQPGYWQWDINLGADFESGLNILSKQLAAFPQALKGQSGTIILQGPWSANIARISSARIIKDLKLIALTNMKTKTIFNCPWQPVSAQFWLQDQLIHPKSSQPNMAKKSWQMQQWPELSSIDPTSLEDWKQTFVKQWQLNWQNPATQFDMLADLAYYRLPENYLLQGYWGINALNTHQLEKYLAQCQASSRQI
mgnify:FL=1|tara:strand:- start:470 stop:1357 length:888 start_codon:yes stop_codon:yes gene_type:complete